VGIAAEHLPKIFDLYFTTKDHGTGIGLSMVYRIVQLHDGDIEVESTEGKGSRFTIALADVVCVNSAHASAGQAGAVPVHAET